MSTSNISTCIAARSVTANSSAFGVCVCQPPFFGETCEHTYHWFEWVMLTQSIVFGLLPVIFVLFWTSLKLGYLHKTKSFERSKLSTVILILALAASVARLFFYMMELPGIMWFHTPNALHELVESVIRILSLVLLMAGTALMAGFWIEVFDYTMRPRLSKRVKVVTGFIALLFLATLSLSYLEPLAKSISSIISICVLSLCVAILCIVVSFARYYRDQSEKECAVPPISHTVSSHAIAILMGLCVAWTAFTVGFAINSFQTNLWAFESQWSLTVTYVICKTLNKASTSAMLILLVVLVDRNGGAVRLANFFLFDAPIDYSADKGSDVSLSFSFADDETSEIKTTSDIEDTASSETITTSV